MFKEIEGQEVKILNREASTITFLPNFISRESLNNLIEATTWLFDEAYKDWQETKEMVNKRRLEEGLSSKNIDDLESLSIRMGSRTQGYVNQLCLAEDILTFEYNRMNSLLREASGGRLSLDPENDYKKLKERFEPIRRFRNKVTAHTAYTSRREEDNPETITRSVLNLFPRPSEFFVGDTFLSGFSRYKSELPIITIFSWPEETEPIFKDWKQLYLDKLSFIHKELPLKFGQHEIESAYPHLVHRKDKSYT